MNIPSKIKIGFKDYDIIFPWDFPDNDSPVMGMCDYQRQELRIAGTDGNRKFKDQTLLHVLIHEILHAIELGSEHKVFKDESGKTNEDALDAWAEWLCMVLKENPEFTKLFLREG